ncbi:16S rRNA processing protein RimM [Williamsoniiplasma luminosum]|uniref:16S rRNA processing protein RimM n=1 Tax=Williamsoniiplasma luminosum TaxID=214888 RepID=A0A2K8NUE8_9MOLU|nr:hypothetical protein [Williamsoniiplasma luminosum]ATZ17429.1 16S rRNA processing protein RimM [Williamsoniiplasma luminosum]
MQEKLMRIGEIVNTVGIKGTVKVLLDSNLDINDLSNFKLCFYQTNSKVFIPLQIKTLEVKNNTLLISFIDFENINDVQKFRNQILYAPIEIQAFSLIPHWTEYKIETELGEGIVIDWMNNSVQYLIKIRVQNHDFWVPMVDEYLVVKNDETKTIQLKNIRGLM